MEQIGIITEQGDLGFGFDQLNESDTKVYNEAINRNKDKSSNAQVINESKKDN